MRDRIKQGIVSAYVYCSNERVNEENQNNNRVTTDNSGIQQITAGKIRSFDVHGRLIKEKD